MADVITKLLPRNSTALEKNLGRLMLRHFDWPVESITGHRFTLPTNWLDLLIEEYGLGEISPYFTDRRELIRQGVAWTRIKGTPAALKQALAWIGQGDAQLREWGPSTEPRGGYVAYGHWAEYELLLPALPSADTIRALVRVATLAQPVRSRLRRLIAGCEREHFRLDATRLGYGLLSDDSGHYQPELAPGLKLSFCASLGAIAQLEFVETAHSAATVDFYLLAARIEQRQLYLDDLPPLFEVYAAINREGGDGSMAVYPGQNWADGPWPDASWSDSRLIVISHYEVSP